MKLCYSDPPYINQAKRHYSHDPSGIEAEEVDHYKLLEILRDNYDGWALSASSPSIFEIVPMINEIFPPHTVRQGAWIKPFCSWKPTHRVQYTWEPVFFIPARPKGSKSISSVRDYVIANMTMRKGTHGAKPPAFCNWILDILGWNPEDTVDDLYPGSGAFTNVLNERRKLNGL